MAAAEDGGHHRATELGFDRPAGPGAPRALMSPPASRSKFLKLTQLLSS